MELPDPGTVVTLARRGLLNPGRPDAVARQVAALLRWGYGLTGELRSAAGRDPGRTALVDEDGSWTYARLRDDADRLALALRNRYGVAPGDRVGLLCRNHAGLVAALVAVGTLGADPVLLNTSSSVEQAAAVAGAHRLRMLVHDDEFAGHAEAAGVTLLGEAPLAELAATGPRPVLAPPPRAGHTIVLTSGTTGVPKGARRPTPPGAGPLAAILSRIPLGTRTRLHVAAPLFHTWGYAGLQLSLALRGTLVLRRRFDPDGALSTLAGHGCDALLAVPVMLQRLLERPVHPGVALRVVATSGSALPGDLAGRFMDAYGDCLYNLYGSTEASWAAIATPDELRAEPGTAGRPPRGTRVEILDDAGRPLGPGAVGRIAVGNDMLFDGYTGGGGRARVRGLLPTGDLGHIGPGGLLFVDGREDDMVVSGGENVFPAEVEHLLARLPGVREVAVVGVPDPEFGARLAAYVVARPGVRLDPEELRGYVRAHLARFAVPRDVHLVEALPRNATGKVVNRDLPR